MNYSRFIYEYFYIQTEIIIIIIIINYSSMILYKIKVKIFFWNNGCYQWGIPNDLRVKKIYEQLMYCQSWHISSWSQRQPGTSLSSFSSSYPWDLSSTVHLLEPSGLAIPSWLLLKRRTEASSFLLAHPSTSSLNRLKI